MFVDVSVCGLLSLFIDVVMVFSGFFLVICFDFFFDLRFFRSCLI